MSWFRSLFAGCWLDHDLVKELRGKKLYFVCQRCGQERRVLPKQKSKYRDRTKAVVRQFRKRSA